MEHNYTSSLTGISRGRFGKLHILRAGSYQDINAVLDALGSVDLSDYVTNSALTTALSTKLDALTGGGAVVISGSGTSRTITVDLSGYYTASQVGILLSGKVSSVTAGTGISITGISTAPVINAAQQLSFKMDGVAQSGVDTIDFLAHTFSLNSGTLTVGPPDFQSRLSLFFASSADKLDLTRDVTGNLLWNAQLLATQSFVSAGFVANSDLAQYSETTGAQTTILQSFDTATPISVHLNWTSTLGAVNTAGSHQALTQTTNDGSYLHCHNTSLNGPAGGTILLDVFLRAGTATSTIIAVNDSTSWSQVYQVAATGLTTTAFTRFTWAFPLPSNSVFNLHIGITPPGTSLTQQAGTIDIQNLRLYRTAAAVTLHSHLTIQGDALAYGSMRATAFTSTSDARFKADVQPLDAAECLAVAQALVPSKYIRTDLGEVETNEARRIGFLAQDVRASLPADWSNIVGQSGFDGGLWLDYAKLTPLLCGAIQALAARVAVLEA